MKRLYSIITVFLLLGLLAGCGLFGDDNGEEVSTYLDGRYRGTYEDRGEQQISIQFALEDEIISNVSYRWLYHSGNDYRQMDESHPLWGVKLQHDQIAENLEGKHISEIASLHNPEDFADDVDGFAAATIRGNKIYSAMRDALNRGLYTPAEEGYSVDLGDFLDGRYRGTYGDRGEQQVSIQFTLTNNEISGVSFRWLYHSENDYRQMDDSHPLWPVKLQHDQLAEYLEGKDISAIFDLHTPGVMADDIDGFAAATLRGNKVYSAMRDALNRGLYTPSEDGYSVDLGEFEDGRYRGIYGDRGEQQVSIQFTLTNNVISNVSYRWLYHSGNDYRQMDESHPLWGVKIQHDQIAEYLEGKNISVIFELHTPELMADDVDGFAAATLRGNKIYSAMRDALNRGLYTPAS